MLTLRRFIRYGILIGAVSGTAVAIKENDWDVTTIGLVRFGRAFTTIASIACDYKFSLNVDRNSALYADLKSDVHWRSAKKLLNLCTLNGGVFIKVGQHLGALDYILPYEYVTTMKVLHSSAPKTSFKDVIRVIEEDLHMKADRLFTTFEREPVGAASLAQVHKATLNDGTVVAVKVQHPQVLGHAYVDMKTMEFLVNVVSVLFPEFKFMWLAEETKKNLPIELQFLNEGKNAEEAACRFKKYPWLKIPKIYWPLSSNRVLTMEYCKGGQIDDHKYMINHKIDTKLVSDRLGTLYSEMIFVQGHVHCDPHPGNIFVEATTSGPRIVLLDHGLYTHLTDEFRMNYCRLWLSLLSADVERIKASAAALGVGSMYGILAAMVTARSWNAITQGIQTQKMTDNETKQIQMNAAKFFPKITEVLENIPREMILILKTNDLLRGIEYSLKRTPGTTFIPMTSFCLQASYDLDLKQCKSSLCRVKIIILYTWSQFRINAYNFLVRVMNYFGHYAVVE